MLTAIRLASSRSNNFAAHLRPGSSSKWTWAKICMLSGTMRLPTGLFSAMLLGVVAMLFGLAIGVTISGGLPDIIVLAPQALPPEPEPEVTDVTNVDLGSPSIADENFNPGNWLQKPIFRTR